MQIVLFEDQVDSLSPVTLTRPAFDVHMAGTTLRSAAEKVADKVMFLVRPEMKHFAKGKLSLSGDVVFLNARIAPDLKIMSDLDKQLPRNSIMKKDDCIVAARCPASRIKVKDDSQALIQTLSKLKLKASKAKLRLLNHPWDIVEFNEVAMASNLKILSSEYSESDSGVFLGEGADVHEKSFIDSSSGPVIVGKNSVVGPFAVIRGPVFIGDECVVHPHALVRKATDLAGNCKVGGEVVETVMQPYSNKQHFGFIGKSYIGSWVNLGAGTANSDLKNTYGTVKVKQGNKVVDTGLQFFGCVIADFCKAAINTSILTGKIIGVSTHLYGVITENVPAFTNYARDLGSLSEFYLDSAIKTQKRMFERRGIKQSSSDVALLKKIYEDSAEERRSAGVPKQRLMFR